jgi:hypothetical protein
MWQRVMAAAGADMALYKRRILRLIVGGVVALVAAIIALVSSIYALFFWVAIHHGPLAGYLAVMGGSLVALLIGLIVARAPAPAAGDSMAGILRDERRRTYAKARALGEGVADAASGRTGPLRSRGGLAKAALGALVIGLLIGRRV